MSESKKNPGTNNKKDILINVIWGVVRRDLPNFIDRIVKFIPEPVKKIPMIDRLLTILGELVGEKYFGDFKGWSRQMSEVIGELSDGIGRSIEKEKIKLKESEVKDLEIVNEALKVMKNFFEKIKKAESIDEIEKEKKTAISALEAIEEVYINLQKITEKFAPEERKEIEKEIDWNKVIAEIGRYAKIVGEKGIEGLKEVSIKGYEKLKELDEKMGKLADQLEEKRRQLKEEREKRKEKSLWRKLKRRFGK